MKACPNGSYSGTMSAHGFYSDRYALCACLNAGNADLGIIILMTLLTAALALVPFIPILRDIPRWIPIHRLIWRSYYAKGKATPAARAT